MDMLPPALRHGFTLHGLAAGGTAFAALALLGVAVNVAAMLGWCLYMSVHAALLLRHLLPAHAGTMRKRSRELAEGRYTIAALSVLASLCALLVVVFQLAQPGTLLETTLAVVTVVLCWFHLHLLFAQEYAHAYWQEEGGIEFPGGDGTPEFSEMLYHAFTVGMTFQVSDTGTTSPRMRRIVMAHALVSFWFSAVVLAAAVNLVGLVDGG